MFNCNKNKKKKQTTPTHKKIKDLNETGKKDLHETEKILFYSFSVL